MEQNAAVIFIEQSKLHRLSLPVRDILAHKLIIVGPGDVTFGWTKF